MFRHSVEVKKGKIYHRFKNQQNGKDGVKLYQVTDLTFLKHLLAGKSQMMKLFILKQMNHKKTYSTYLIELALSHKLNRTLIDLRLSTQIVVLHLLIIPQTSIPKPHRFHNKSLFKFPKIPLEPLMPGFYNLNLN